jgi:hypothetical protein
MRSIRAVKMIWLNNWWGWRNRATRRKSRQTRHNSRLFRLCGLRYYQSGMNCCGANSSQVNEIAVLSPAMNGTAQSPRECEGASSSSSSGSEIVSDLAEFQYNYLKWLSAERVCALTSHVPSHQFIGRHSTGSTTPEAGKVMMVRVRNIFPVLYISLPGARSCELNRLHLQNPINYKLRSP